jgi:hypothetical protein
VIVVHGWDDAVQRSVVVRPADDPLPPSAELLADGVAADAATDGAPAGPDLLVPPPGSGLPGWYAHTLAAVRAGWWPMLVLTCFCAALPMLISVRLADTVVVAPLLQELAGGVGLLLLPAIWLIVVGVRSLLTALCLTGIAGVAVGWGASGRVPALRAVLPLAGHRVHPVWGWSAVVYAGEQALHYAVPSMLMGGPATTTDRLTVLVTVSSAVLAWVVAVFVGVLGPVVLFERGRGPRRAVHLLVHGARGPVLGLVLTSAAMIAVPLLVRTASPEPFGVVPAALLTVVLTLAWAVSTMVTYAASAAEQDGAPRVGPLVTSASMRDALVAE